MKFGKAPRRLTKEMQEFIDRKTKIPFYSWFGVFASLTPALVFIHLGFVLWDMIVRSGILMIIYLFVTGLFLGWTILQVHSISNKGSKEKKYYIELFKHGEKKTLKVKLIEETKQVRVNNWPMHRITFEWENRSITIFDPRIIDYAKDHKKLEVLIHPETKDIVPVMQLVKSEGIVFRKIA